MIEELRQYEKAKCKQRINKTINNGVTRFTMNSKVNHKEEIKKNPIN